MPNQDAPSTFKLGRLHGKVYARELHRFLEYIEALAEGGGGSQGPQGPQGAAGAVGAQGAVGATGAQGTTGAQGVQGAVGAQGTTGAQGLEGAQGATGPAPWTFIGAYDNGASYNLGDAVTYEGGFYYRTGNPLNPGYPPTPGSINASWTPVADGGAQGVQGPQGDAGPQGDVGPQGVQGVQGATGAQGAIGYPITAVYGSFSDSTDQAIPTGSAIVAKFNTTDVANGVSITSNGSGFTRLTVASAGVYSFGLSPQLYHTGGGTETITFWGRINGIDIPNSASSFEMGNNNNRTLPYIELITPMLAGQWFEWAFTASSGTSVTLEASPLVVGPPAIPAIPSVIATVKLLGA